MMVKAATGGDSNSEPLPIVFVVPKLLPSSLERACASLTGFFSYSLLGYGDVGVPGLLVTLCLKFDMRRRPKSCCRLYFAVAGVGKHIALSLLLAQPQDIDYITQIVVSRDLTSHTSSSSSSLTTAYIVGLLLTFVALVLMKTAQPALLYLVPTTLGSVTFVAVVRREFTVFFTGEVRRRRRRE